MQIRVFILRLSKEWLIRILGGVTDHKYQIVIWEINEKSAELKAYRQFIDSVYFYAGNYPAWKAQQEYREYLHKIGLPLEKNYSNLVIPCSQLPSTVHVLPLT